VWQIGTAYFGCRTADGRFDPERFQERARLERVRMIELKLSQGAKPGHGGLLPAAKVTAEIAEACGIPEGVDSLCPAAHPGLDSPRKLLELVERLRELSGGKPVGLKLCLGRRSELLGLCKAMVASGLWPDFITVDGSEGGSGAAPAELALHAGTPLDEALPYVHDALTGVGLREHVRLIATGRIATGFDVLEKRALGADLCAAGRAFMLALGCLQAFECDRNTCPTGVATQDRRLSRGLVVRDKERRVASFHDATVRGFQELMGSMGLREGRRLSPSHVLCREADGTSRALGARWRPLEPGALLGSRIPEHFAGDWAAASAERF
jgi:glutamate synthase domain-containing protein 2